MNTARRWLKASGPRGSRRRRLLALLAVLLFLAGMPDATADSLDDFIAPRMRERQIEGLSVAIVEKGGIVDARGYGFTDGTRKVAVTSDTLFQSGSISKPVAALAALRLVEQGTLSLDEDVNLMLRSWKVPENEFTAAHKVTLRHILSHSAGFTVHGFYGYSLDSPVPTLVEVLDGRKPANSAPIRVATVPGSLWQYSGGGYVVMQQMMIDAVGRSFPEIMRDLVLQPSHMTASTYEQPLPAEKEGLAATGHYPGGERVPGRWHVYPEMTAAGLWATPSDLARFLIVLQQCFAGVEKSILSERMAREMLTPQKDHCGLGLFLRGSGQGLRFFHEGRNNGFDALLVGTAATGQGAVVMINANDNSGTCGEIVNEIAREYRWPAKRP